MKLKVAGAVLATAGWLVAPVYSHTINIASCLEMIETKKVDGTTGSSGNTCGKIGEATQTYVDAVNSLNNGRGFAVYAGQTDPLYFRLNYTLATFPEDAYFESGNTTNNTRAMCQRVFENASFVVGQGRGCPDAITMDQASMSKNLSTTYVTQRGPSELLTSNGRNDYLFSTHLNSDQYPYLGIQQCALAGAKTIAVIYEDFGNLFLTGVGKQAVNIAEDANMTVKLSAALSLADDGSQDVGALRSYLQDAVDTKADMILVSVNTILLKETLHLLQSLRDEHTFSMAWFPQVPWGGATCAGITQNCSYAIGATQISLDQAYAATDDVFGGMAYKDFVAEYNADTSTHSTDVYTAVSAIVQSVQNVFQFRAIDSPETFLQDTTSADYDYLVTYMRQGRYIGETFHGPLRFDDNGQNAGRDPTTFQVDEADGTALVVFPSDFAEAPTFNYPAPVASTCPASHRTRFYGWWQGLDKDPSRNFCLLCARVCEADEEMNYIGGGYVGAGIFFMVTNWSLALGAIVWTLANRQDPIVKKSQPAFLVLIGVGCITSSSTIIPMLLDDNGRSVDVASDACMTFPWLYTLGFALTFSSLYTKVLRVKRVFNSKRLKVRRINVKMDVLAYVGGGVALQGVIMAIFTLVSPLEFVRTCDKWDDFGACMESSGGCENPDNDLYKTLFIPITACVHFVFLLYAVVLCYQTKDIPTEYQEGRWISMAIFSNIQVMMLGAPLVALVSGSDPGTSFLVRAAIIWLNDGGVLLLIFGPKLYARYGNTRLANSVKSCLGGGSIPAQVHPGNDPVTMSDGTAASQAMIMTKTSTNESMTSSDETDKAIEQLHRANRQLRQRIDELERRNAQASLAECPAPEHNTEAEAKPGPTAVPRPPSFDSLLDRLAGAGGQPGPAIHAWTDAGGSLDTGELRSLLDGTSRAGKVVSTAGDLQLLAPALRTDEARATFESLVVELGLSGGEGQVAIEASGTS